MTGQFPWNTKSQSKFCTSTLRWRLTKFRSLKGVHKLKGVGIQGRLLDCIESFLTNRLQSVRIGTVQSKLLPVISGVPQGSVLGPFLFLLYINDLPEFLNTSISSKLFADDLKAYGSYDKIGDNEEFQINLNRLVVWSNRWQLKLSVSKCGSLLITGNSNVDDIQKLFIGREMLPALDSVKDPGVIVDPCLNFSKHSDGAVYKANHRVYLLLRSFKNRNLSLMVFAFKVYILPLLN